MALTPDNPIAPQDKRARAQAASEDVLLREVDEAVRQDQYAHAARKYGKTIAAVVIAGLLAFGGYLFWQSRQHAAAERESEALIAAMDKVQKGDLASGATALSPLVNDGTGAAKTAAQLLQAGVALEQNKPADAVKLFDAVAADTGAPQEYRDVATIRSVATRYDQMRPADVVAKLKPLAVPGGAWFGPAGELVAMAYLDQGKNAEAGALFAAIARDKDAAESLRSRARQMAGLLGVDAVDDVDTVIARQDSGIQGGETQ